jgi:hypothetical protein
VPGLVADRSGHRHHPRKSSRVRDPAMPTAAWAYATRRPVSVTE